MAQKTTFKGLPEAIERLSDTEAATRIQDHKRRLGERLVILGHHYQDDKIVQVSDFKGDSYELAKMASEQKGAEYIVFCGVRFMAEAARVLAGLTQRVFHPDPQAGCPMADMADIDEVQEAWDSLTKTVPASDWTPITYMNSSVELKALCGRNDGAVCTSSNADKLFKWAFGRGQPSPLRGLSPRRVFFFPDEHLGRNTAHSMGISEEEIAVWDPRTKGGGNSPEKIKTARVIVWKGFCHVHTYFTTAMVKAARKKYPETKVIVHPECPREVVELSDEAGSTSQIIKYVAASPKDSVIFVGTEIHLVNRLAKEHTDKTVLPLSPSSCPNMARVSLQNLLWTLDEWPEANEVKLDKETIRDARTALQRMIEVTSIGD